jgi:hypothetical protein
MGLVALGILAPAEIAGVLRVRGLSLHEYLESFMTAPRGHFGGHVPAFCSDAVSRHAISTRPRRSDLLSLPVQAKGHCAASQPWTEISEPRANSLAVTCVPKIWLKVGAIFN